MQWPSILSRHSGDRSGARPSTKPAGVTRRGFLRATGLAAAAGATIGVLPGCTNPEQRVVPEPMVVDEKTATSVIDDFEETDLELRDIAEWSLPLGSVLHEATSTWIPVTQAGASASPMVIGCAFNAQDGGFVEVVSNVMGDGHTVVVYDTRCSDEVYAWVELDYLTHAWSLYAARFNQGQLDGNPTTLWQADNNYDPPGFTCVGNSVLWQVTPSLSGQNTKEPSYCYLWKLGDANAQAVVESPGRFPIEPSVSGDVVVLAPRVRADEGVFYGVTAYLLKDDLNTIVDQLVLPQSVRPFYASYVGDRFAVSIEANYSSGGMFGEMGTYLGSGEGPFVRLAREPSANVAGKDDVFIIKSRASYFVVNLRKSTYSILTAANRCVDYGEYPARIGQTNDFVTFATVKDEASGYPSSVTVRTFAL